MKLVFESVVGLVDWAASDLASGSEDFEAENGATRAMGHHSEEDLEKVPARRT